MKTNKQKRVVEMIRSRIEEQPASDCSSEEISVILLQEISTKLDRIYAKLEATSANDIEGKQTAKNNRRWQFWPF